VKGAEQHTIHACMEAIGEVLGRDIVALGKRCAALETEIAKLKGRDLDRRLRAVPATPEALIA
jgi:hypothetical protein